MDKAALLTKLDRARGLPGYKGAALVFADAVRHRVRHVLESSRARELQLAAILRAGDTPCGLVIWRETGKPMAIPFQEPNGWGLAVLEFFISKIKLFGLN